MLQKNQRRSDEGSRPREDSRAIQIDLSDGENQSEGEDIYTVEAIRDKRVNRGKVEYLIKWEGYPENQCTWEPVAHLDSVPEMIEEFEKNYKKKEPTKSKEAPRKSNDKPAKTKDTKGAKPSKSSKTISTKTQAKPSKKESNKKGKMSIDNEDGEDGTDQESAANSGNESASDTEVSHEHSGGTKKIKISNEVSIQAKRNTSVDDLPLQGNYNYGDKSKKIINAKFESAGDMNYILCFVEWEPRKNGVQPYPTPFTSIDLRTKDPLLLIDFYESRLKINPAKNKESTDKKDREEGKTPHSQKETRMADLTTTEESKINRTASQERIEQNKGLLNKYSQGQRPYNPEEYDGGAERNSSTLDIV